jgi:F0F1-type ATP synthase membrane subunit b/b'
MAESIEEARQFAANAETEVESLREESASILSAARTQTYLVYAALIISIVSFIMGFVGPLQITRKRPV